MQDIHSSMTNTTRDNLLAGEVDQPPINNHHDNLKCPRCQSLNTKFCYYNNYNLSQPRHLCKSCRRYWTNGGILRNVPVGGGIRKTKPKPKRSSKLKTGAEMVVCNYSNSENFSSDCLNATRSNTSTTTTTTNYSSSENFCNDGSGVTTNTTTNNNYSSSENFSSDCSGVTTNTTTANTTTSDPSSVKPDMLVNFNELSAQMLCSPVGRFDMMLNQSQMNNDLQWTDMEMNMPEMRSSVMMDYDNNNMGFENMKSDGQVVGKDDRRNIDGEDLYYLSGTVDEFYWCHNQWCGDDDDGDRGQLDCLT